MTTNKEHIERIEADLGSLQDKISRMEFEINDKLQRMEDTISKLGESFSASRGATSQENDGSTARPIREESEGGRQPILPRVAKLEFPRYSSDDPTE
ncbi:hypothetical protein AB3S75_027775 [Citrus x aurantiifolia]